MTSFLDAALGFPAVLFTFLLMVLAGYWLFVLLGAVELNAFDGAGVDGDVSGEGLTDGPEADGFGGILAAAGLGGVPLTMVLTLLVGFAWLISLAGTVATQRVQAWGPAQAAVSALVLPVALGGAWAGARAVVIPLRRLLPDDPPASRTDFVGRTCVIRTGRVGPDFGQAEVTASDGSSAVIQVRMAGAAFGSSGWTALIYEYDTDGEVFWVTPLDPAYPIA
jgi:hypothetical protein